ncbi:hypothetical protein [Tamilnaduibacter salinus]|nr:hypothetical protein [Tamilnaduibacter salinus]
MGASKDFGRVDVDLELVGRSGAPDNPEDLPGHVLTNVGIGFEARET